MKYLLDTHAYLWATQAEANLNQSVRDAISNEDNDVFLSIASLWEIAIKVSLGKLHLDTAFRTLAIEMPITFGLKPLEIAPQHLILVSQLPFHHRDPFDRLLVAQCLADDMTILSNDTVLDSYGVERLW
jgi:PIN domain nuclease of toxin-antitoxin system